MAPYYETLSPNQVEALGKPCRKCGKGPAKETEYSYYINSSKPENAGVQKRHGRYGPWVQCSNCGDKVYRPRGRAFNQSQQTPKQALPVVQSATISEDKIVETITALALPHFATLDAKLTDVLDSKLNVIEKRASAALGVAEAEIAKLRAATPVVIHVKQVDNSVKVVKDAHFLMPRLLRVLAAGFYPYLWGDAGTGKTTAALQALEALGREGEIDTLDLSTFRSMIQGFMSSDGQRKVPTAFTRCWEGGKGYIADETDNAPGHVQTLFNSALANGHAPLAWGSIEKRDGFAFIGTGNTPGRPTRAFPDRKPMSAAFADRLYFMYWPLDPMIEARIGGLTPAPRKAEVATTCTAAQWVSFVIKLREWAKVECPTLMITPRASIIGVKALEIGESPSDVADALIFRGADSEIRSKALNAVRLP